jgi:2-Cys peroxiredoxin 5
MSLRHSIRTLPRVSLRTSVPARRSFQTTRPAFISVGDKIPALDVLMEDTPGSKVDLAREIETKGDALIIGVPAAFSGSCSAVHVPSYINHPKTKDFPVVAVVSVNDVFV